MEGGWGGVGKVPALRFQLRDPPCYLSNTYDYFKNIANSLPQSQEIDIFS